MWVNAVLLFDPVLPTTRRRATCACLSISRTLSTADVRLGTQFVLRNALLQFCCQGLGNTHNPPEEEMADGPVPRSRRALGTEMIDPPAVPMAAMLGRWCVRGGIVCVYVLVGGHAAVLPFHLFLVPRPSLPVPSPGYWSSRSSLVGQCVEGIPRG